MALPVLDGNQSATTLSSVVTGGEHIVAHTVVSLGSTAISNITNAVSGVTIAGTVTANVPLSIDGYSAVTGVRIIGAGLDGGIRVQGIDPSTFSTANLEEGGAIPIFSSNNNPLPISGTVTANVADPSYVILSGVEAGIQAYASDLANDPLPISGTVTANVSFAGTNGTTLPSNIAILGAEEEGGGNARTLQADSSGLLKVSLQDSGTNIDGKIIAFDGTSNVDITATTDGSKNRLDVNASGTVTVGNSVTIASFATSVTARLIDALGNTLTYGATGSAGTPSPDVISVQGISGGTAVSVSISSVTIGAVPNGSLTTRFGSVTTANTAQISSAVTNATRRYLLIQNVTTSSNVITVGIGFTPTTTQGIQLTAGGGITFESSYIPTGAVYVLSSVTASPFTILEA